MNSFIYKMKVGDIVFSCYSSTTIDAIGVVTGDYEWCDNQFDDGLNRMRKVNWIVKGINEDIVEDQWWFHHDPFHRLQVEGISC